MSGQGAAGAGRPMWGASPEWLWRGSKPKADVAALPSTLDLGPWRFSAAFLFALAAVVAFYSTDALALVDHASPWWLVLVVLAMPGAALLLVLAAAWAFVTRRRITFMPEGVEVDDRTPLGRSRWSMGYREFAGVRHRQKQVRGRYTRHTYQIVELYHPDPARRLPLYVAFGDDFPRERLEAYAKRFDLSTLVETPDGVATRSDLDASFRERVEAGEATIDAAYRRAPPRGLEVAHASEPEQAIRVRLTAGRIPLWISLLVWVLFGAPVVLWALGPEQDLRLLAGLPAIALWAGLWWYDRRHPRELVITRERIRVKDDWAWTRPNVEELALDEIEDVRLHRSKGKPGIQVMIEADRGTMAVGQGLSRRALKWLKSLVASAVATA